MSSTGSSPAIESLAAELALAAGQLVRRLRTQGQPGGLSLSQLAVLARLEPHDGITAAELARAEAMKPQSMGSILAALAAQDLVRRRPDPRDGRRILFALTAKGAAIRAERSAAKRQWLATALARLHARELQTLGAAVPLIKQLGQP